MPFWAHQISLNCLHPTEGSFPPSDFFQIKLIFLDMRPIGLLGLYYGTLSGSIAPTIHSIGEACVHFLHL